MRTVVNQEQYIYEARHLKLSQSTSLRPIMGAVNFTPSPLFPREIISILLEQKIGWTPDPVSMYV